MPDKLITNKKIYYAFIENAINLDFDAIIAWDTPTYIDLPLYNSWTNLIKGIQLTIQLIQYDIPIIALIKGNTPNQINYSIKTLKKIGFKNYAIHTSEYIHHYKKENNIQNILETYANKIRENEIKNLLIIGALKPSSIKIINETFKNIPKLSIAGYSYYLDAKNYKLYYNQGEANIYGKYYNCKCPTCQNTNPEKLLTNTTLRAIHNLNQIKRIITGKEMYKAEFYDLIINQNEKTLIISDLHAWTNESQFNQFIKFLNKIKPNHLILLGDTFDLKNGTPRIAQILEFFNHINQIKPTIHIVKGCSDNNLYDLIKAMDQLAFMKIPPQLIYKLKEKTKTHIFDYVIIDFYRLYRQAKNKLKIKLPNNQTILILHGHQIIPNPTINLNEIKNIMTNYKKKFKNIDWLIIGHIHRAFIDHKNKIASPGCWQIPTKQYQGITTKNDINKAILIDQNGNLKLIGANYGAI